jgi:hypothetical protein
MQEITLNTISRHRHAPVHSNQNTNVHINESGYANSKSQYKVKEDIIAKRKRQSNKANQRGAMRVKMKMK